MLTKGTGQFARLSGLSGLDHTHTSPMHSWLLAIYLPGELAILKTVHLTNTAGSVVGQTNRPVTGCRSQ